jgi:uncharacterized membrane protein YdjX (TVP38/TMEM64 family)
VQGWGRQALLLVVLLGGIGLAWGLRLEDGLRLKHLASLEQWVAGYGPWAPLLFIAGYVVLEMAFVPALPLTLLGGLAFGPLRGTVYVSVAATLSAALAFLFARHMARGTVELWIARHARLARLDAAVAEHGWRILMITRLVPIFPFNVQNFAYGLTRIPFWTYVGMSWLCMLPGTVAYVLAGSALPAGANNPVRLVGYLGVAGILLVALSLLPRWLKHRSRIAGELF